MKWKLVPSQATHHMIARAMYVRRDLERMGNSSDYQRIHIMWHEMSCSAPQPPKLSDERILHHLDAILKASGSGMKNYSMHKTIEDMKQAVRAIEREILGGEF